MDADRFRDDLLPFFGELERRIATDEGDWAVKGFVDIYRNVYTWMNYLTNDMARAIDSAVPYRNLAEYLTWSRPEAH